MQKTNTLMPNPSAHTPKSIASSAVAHRLDISPKLLTKLIEEGQIKVLTVEACGSQIQREYASLKRLQNNLITITSPKLSKRTHNQMIAVYLNLYDQLFRYVSLALLQLGYALTTVRPHQTLTLISAPYSHGGCINQMIKTRHQLKKGHSNEINPVAVQTLDRLLKSAGYEDWQACQILITSVNKLSY